MSEFEFLKAQLQHGITDTRLQSFQDKGGVITLSQKDVAHEIIDFKLKGKLHRVDGPARLSVLVNMAFQGSYGASIEEWFLDGKEHREDGPCLIHHGHDGLPDLEIWKQFGKLKAPPGAPALIDRKQMLWVDDQELPHRDDDLPAIVGQRGRKEWFQHGQRHRTGGPAVIQVNGTRKYYEHGELLKTEPSVKRTKSSANTNTVKAVHLKP